MLKTPPPSSAAVAPHSSIQSSTGGIVQSAYPGPMALLASAERLYRYLATAFAGLADEQAVKHHLYACFGIPILHGDMEIACQVPPEFTAELANLGTYAVHPPMSAEAWLRARACWPQACFIPHEVQLAMAGVLFAAHAGPAAFRDTAELDLAQFRDFLVAYLGPVDAALMDIPLTAMESSLITGGAPDHRVPPEMDAVAATRAAAELAQQMQARLVTMPTLLRYQQHSQSFDVLVRHAERAWQAEILVNIPLCTRSAPVELSHDMETAVQAPLPACSPGAMTDLLWVSGTSVWPVSLETHRAETLMQIFKAVLDLPDQRHACEILGCFDRHQLLAHDIRVPAVNGTRATHVPLLPYVMAARKFHLARWLLELPLDVNRTDAAGRTALHYAADAGQAHIAGILLSRGAELNVTDGDGRTPLHVAAQNCHVEVMQTMLRRLDPAMRSALLHARDGRGYTPLGLALRHEQTAYGPCPSRAALVESFCLMLIDSMVESGTVPRLLIEAVEDVEIALFRHLYKNRLGRILIGDMPFLRMTDDAGRTPLLRALAARRLDIARFLLREGADLLHTSSCGSALHIWLSAWCGQHDSAAMASMLSGLRMLLAHAELSEETTVLVNCQSRLVLCNGGWHNIPPPLHMACEYQFHAAIPLLLKHGADPMLRSRLGHSVLEAAIMGALQYPQGGVACLEMLHDFIGEERWTRIVNAPNADGVSPLRALQRQLPGGGQPPPVVSRLICFLRAHGATDYPDIPGQKRVTTRARSGEKLWREWDAAISKRDLMQVPVVLNMAPGSVNVINEAGQTPLMQAVAVNACDIVGAMLSIPDLDITARDALGRTALHYAAQYGCFESAVLLVRKEPELCRISSGLHLQIGQTASTTPLHVAARSNHDKIVDFLLKQKVIMPMVLDGEDGNFLHQAVSHGALEVIRLLKGNYPDLLCNLLDQRTALHKRAPLEYAAHQLMSAPPAIAERIEEASRELHAFLAQRNDAPGARRPHRPCESLDTTPPATNYRGRPVGSSGKKN